MADKVDLAEVRRWAKDNDIEVAARGAVSNDVIEKFKSSKESEPVDKSEPDAPAGHVDAAGIKDEVTATVTTEDAPAEESTSDDTPAEPVSLTEDEKADEWMRRYRAARGIPDTISDAAVAINAKLSRNRVSLQTLENGFIHNQRATGTDEVQARLVAAGYLNGFASGQADENTVMAYARYQDSLGLPGTGIPERTSLEALDFDVLE